MGLGFAMVVGVDLGVDLGIGLGVGNIAGARAEKAIFASFAQNTHICSLHEQFAQSIHALLQYTSCVVFLQRGHAFSEEAGYLSLHNPLQYLWMRFMLSYITLCLLGF